MRRTDALVLVIGVACLDLPFAALMRAAAPDEALALLAGLIALTLAGAVAVGLALRARARGGWVIAIALPASLSASWCAAAAFALQGGMHFVRLWGVFARGTDPDWIKVLSVVALAHAAIVGPALALVLRARGQALDLPTRDGGQRIAGWAIGTTAFVASASTLALHEYGALVTAACAVALVVVAWRSARLEAWARALGTSGATFAGPIAEGVLPIAYGAPVERGAWERRAGGPYRANGEEAAPVALVSACADATVRPLRRRRVAMLATACGTLAFSAVALSAWR